MLGLENTEDYGDSIGEFGDSLPYVDLGKDASISGLDFGYYHGCALLSCRSHMKCWGYGVSTGLERVGNVGDDPHEMGDMLIPVDIAGAPTSHPTSSPSLPAMVPTCIRIPEPRIRVTKLSTMNRHTCVLFEGSQAKVS